MFEEEARLDDCPDCGAQMFDWGILGMDLLYDFYYCQVCKKVFDSDLYPFGNF